MIFEVKSLTNWVEMKLNFFYRWIFQEEDSLENGWPSKKEQKKWGGGVPPQSRMKRRKFSVRLKVKLAKNIFISFSFWLSVKQFKKASFSHFLAWVSFHFGKKSSFVWAAIAFIFVIFKNQRSQLPSLTATTQIFSQPTPSSDPRRTKVLSLPLLLPYIGLFFTWINVKQKGLLLLMHNNFDRNESNFVC